jgi:site-specific recombinase XerD
MKPLNEPKDKFLEYLTQNRGRSISTAKAYDCDLTHFIKYLMILGITEHVQVTTETIEDYLGKLPVSPITKSRNRSAIKSFYRYLYIKRQIPDDPGARLESIKLPSREPVYLNQQEYQLILAEVRRSSPYYRKRDSTIISLLLQSGIRRAELVALNVGDVDVSNNRLRVIRKGNKEQLLPIHPDLVIILEDYLNTRHTKANQPLFMSKLGNRLSASALWYMIKGYAHRAGLNPRITVHSLRHSFCSSLLSQEIQLPYIAQLMGHKSPQSTSRYLHFERGQLEEALSKVRF